jgi:hypothetical protein
MMMNCGRCSILRTSGGGGGAAIDSYRHSVQLKKREHCEHARAVLGLELTFHDLAPGHLRKGCFPRF